MRYAARMIIAIMMSNVAWLVVISLCVLIYDFDTHSWPAPYLRIVLFAFFSIRSSAFSFSGVCVFFCLFRVCGFCIIRCSSLLFLLSSFHRYDNFLSLWFVVAHRPPLAANLGPVNACKRRNDDFFFLFFFCFFFLSHTVTCLATKFQLCFARNVYRGRVCASCASCQ